MKGTKAIASPKAFLLAAMLSVAILLILIAIPPASAPPPKPSFSLTYQYVMPMGIPPTPATFFSLSNATSERWLCIIKSVEYKTPQGWATNALPNTFILGKSGIKQIYIPGIVTNKSVTLQIDCTGKAKGLRGILNDWEDKMDAPNVRRLNGPGASSETFSGGQHLKVVVSETQK